jgi:hypothetical protein
MEMTAILIAAAFGGFCVGVLAMIGLLRLIRNVENRTRARLNALEARMEDLEIQRRRDLETRDKTHGTEMRARKNLVAIIKGLAVSALRIDRRLKALERRTP